MSEQGASSRSTGMSRRSFLRGTAAAGAGGLVIGGGAGYGIGRSSSDSSSSSGSKDAITIGSASPITGPFAGDGQQMVRGQEVAVEQINAAGGVARPPAQARQARHPGPAARRDEDGDPEPRLEERRRVFMPFCSYTSVEFPILAQKQVPTFHVNTWHGNVDWVAQNAVDEHLPGRPDRALVRRRDHPGPPDADRQGHLDADEEDHVRRHVERPVQPQHRQQLPGRDQKLGWSVLGFEQVHGPRRPTGAGCSSRSATPIPT